MSYKNTLASNQSDDNKVDLEITSEIIENHEKLLIAIKSEDIHTVKQLLDIEKTPLYIHNDDPDTFSEHVDPIVQVARKSDNDMLKILLEHGANPFYNFNNYEKAISIIREKRNDLFFNIMFDHLVTLDSTPDAMKQLWALQYPFTKDAVSQAYKDRNFEALALFSKLNFEELTHFWLEPVWVLANNNNDVQGMYKFQEILISNQKYKNKVPFATSKGVMMAMANRNHKLVNDLFALGVNPHVRAGNQYGKSGVRIYNKQSLLNLFKMAVIYNYDAIAKQLLEDDYEMSQKEAVNLFDLMLDSLIQPTNDSTSFHRTVKVLVEYGLPVSRKHIKAFEAKTRYAKKDQIEEYSQTMNLLVAKEAASTTI